MPRNLSTQAAAAGAADVAVPATDLPAQAMEAAPAPDLAEAPPGELSLADAHHGQGGLYEIKDGQRVLMERTAADEQLVSG